MKKRILMFSVAMALTGIMVGCGSNGKKIDVNSDVKTLHGRSPMILLKNFQRRQPLTKQFSTMKMM